MNINKTNLATQKPLYPFVLRDQLDSYTPK
jgi:hypothetical protein